MAAISIEKIHRKENMMFLVSEWLLFIVRPPKVLRGWDAVCDFKLAPQKTLYSTLYIFIGLNNNGGTYTQVLTIFFFMAKESRNKYIFMMFILVLLPLFYWLSIDIQIAVILGEIYWPMMSFQAQILRLFSLKRCDTSGKTAVFWVGQKWLHLTWLSQEKKWHET